MSSWCAPERLKPSRTEGPGSFPERRVLPFPPSPPSFPPPGFPSGLPLVPPHSLRLLRRLLPTVDPYDPIPPLGSNPQSLSTVTRKWGFFTRLRG